MGRSWNLAGAVRTQRQVGSSRNGLTRRAAVRAAWSAAATAATAAGATLLLPPQRTAAGSAPTPAAAHPIVLWWLPTQVFPEATNDPRLWDIIQQGMRPFLDRNPGVEVRPYPQAFQGAVQTALLAGTGPDVFSDWVAPPFVEADLMLDLTPFIKRDNIDLSVFITGEIDFFRECALFSPTNTSALYMLPAYLHTEAQAVNLGVLDSLGLKYPEPDWGIHEWTRLWEATTIKSGPKQRFGSDYDWQGYDYGGNGITPYMFHGFDGGYVDPRRPTRSKLDSPGSLACGNWLLPLIWEGVLGIGSDYDPSNFAKGKVVCTHDATCFGCGFFPGIPWQGLKWDFFPDPAWPVRRSSYAASDFNAIWAGTRYPEQAWELLKWCTVEPDFQRLMIKTGLVGPNQTRLWPEWAETVRQVAPSLRDKNLEGAFVQPVLNEEPYFGHVFRYAEAQVQAIISRYAGLLLKRQIGVDEAFRAMAHEIDAAQDAAAAEAAAEARAAAAFARYVRAAEAQQRPTTFPAPPRTGAGSPPRPAGSLVRVDERTGRYALRGTGAGVVHGTDGMTFACAAERSSRGTFTCRLVSLTAAAGHSLSNGAKAGLMARSDLSSTAAEVGVEVALGHGVHVHVVPMPGTFYNDHRPPTPTQASGLIGASVLLADGSKPAKNYLLKPVWLRLALEVDRWTAYTSFDGRTWTLAFGPAGAEFVGAWVGLFATGHGGHALGAVFDHVSGFTPDTFVEVGS